MPSKIITLPAKGTSINPANGGNNNGTVGKVTTLPGKLGNNPATGNNGTTGKVTTFPGKINNPGAIGTSKGGAGKVTTFPGKINANPIRVQNRPAPRNFGGSFGGGHSGPRFATQSRSSFGGGGGGGFGGGGFRR
jgi:hypothetical protein